MAWTRRLLMCPGLLLLRFSDIVYTVRKLGDGFPLFVVTRQASNAWSPWRLAWAANDWTRVCFSTVCCDISLRNDPDLSVRRVARKLVVSACLSSILFSTALTTVVLSSWSTSSLSRRRPVAKASWILGLTCSRKAGKRGWCGIRLFR